MIAPPTVALCSVSAELQQNSQILSWFLTRLLNCYFQTHREGLSDFQKCSVNKKEILQTTEVAILHGCIHRDVFTVSVCVYTRCLYFFIAVEGGRYCWGTYFGSSGMNATQLSGWGLPLSSPLRYKKFDECYRPKFAFESPPCCSCGPLCDARVTSWLWWTFLKKGGLLRPICQAGEVSMNLFA